jgi:ribosomal protein S15P/S13E
MPLKFDLTLTAPVKPDLPALVAAFQAAHSDWIKADYQVYCLERDLHDLEKHIRDGEKWLEQRRFLPAEKRAPGRALMDEYQRKATVLRADILEVAPLVDTAREAMDAAEDAALKMAGVEKGHVCRFCGMPTDWNNWEKHGATCIVEGKE